MLYLKLMEAFFSYTIIISYISTYSTIDEHFHRTKNADCRHTKESHHQSN